MRVSTRARYAIRLMIDLVHLDDGANPVNLKRIADQNALSRGYLEQLMVSLRNAQLVHGVSGRKGGYVLARPAGEITLNEIVEAAIGPINLVGCVLFPESCARSVFCESRPLWVLANAKIKETLEQYTLAQIVSDGWLAERSGDLAPIVGELAYPEKVIRDRCKKGFPTRGCRGEVIGKSGCGLPSRRRRERAGTKKRSVQSQKTAAR